MGKIIKENKAFIAVYIVMLAIMGAVLLMFSKEDIHLFTNVYHNSFFDFFFKNLTYLGDGIAFVVLTVLFLFVVSYRKALIIGLSGVLGGLTAQFFKRVVFPDVVRPKLHFDGIAELYLVPGVDVNTLLSLPSGHTTTAFALFFVLSTFTSNKWLKLACVIMAALVGYSRIYLSQHFLVDVFMGSIIGVVAAVIVVYLINLSSKKSWDGSVMKIFK